MPRPSRSDQIDAALLARVGGHPRDLVRVVASELGLSRAAVVARVRELVEAGLLASSGGTRPTYQPGPHHRAHFRYALAGLQEDTVWLRDIAPMLQGLPTNVLEICQHGVTEMVNNAIDHSEGTTLAISVERAEQTITLRIEDDGVGIFRKISRALDLPDQRLALLELSKGKLTTDPRRHSGEGVFFTSRMFDLFGIESGDLVFDHNELCPNDFLLEDGDPELAGTRVSMLIESNSGRSAKAVFDAFSSGPDDYAFAKTIVPVRLVQLGDENLVSRSQAKRLLRRVDRFRCVELDFEGVTQVGQAFADEIFRVFALDHPEVELVAVHAVPEVQQMIRRAEVLRDDLTHLSVIPDSTP
jgi:anti-sigma regulatory factor (Ser/Thr protein kinase)